MRRTSTRKCAVLGPGLTNSPDLRGVCSAGVGLLAVAAAVRDLPEGNESAVSLAVAPDFINHVC